MHHGPRRKYGLSSKSIIQQDGSKHLGLGFKNQAADEFVGNLASTFSFAIVQQRDMAGKPRNALRFWGMPDTVLPLRGE